MNRNLLISGFILLFVGSLAIIGVRSVQSQGGCGAPWKVPRGYAGCVRTLPHTARGC